MPKLIFFLLLTALFSCSSDSSPVPVDFLKLVSNPPKYHGKVVRTSGWYVDAFETSALGKATDRRGNVTYLVEPSIWIDKSAVKSEADCFVTETVPHAKFCHAEVEGRFEYGASYGHLGAYKYQITTTK